MMTRIRWGRYRKTFVALSTAVCTTVEIYYMGESWAPPFLTFAGAILVYFTPNDQPPSTSGGNVPDVPPRNEGKDG